MFSYTDLQHSYFSIQLISVNIQNRPATILRIMHFWPRAGSRVVRIDPLHFLAGCRTRRLNQV